MTNAWEIGVVLLLLVVSLIGSYLRRGRPALRVCRRGVRWLSRPRIAWLFCGGLSLILNLAVSWGIHWPQPAVQDEFAYLLAADTFASGRLTNPPHPMAEFFETFHVLQRPTYQSKYPPGQGLALALGQLLTGEPIVGAWLSMAAASAAICWMLQGWVPRRWALIGGLLTALHYHLITGWGQSYWGGGVALLGGALVYGAIPRMFRELQVRHGLLLAFGLILLANSRPYEGLVAVIPAAGMVFAGWFRGRLGNATATFSRLVCPVLVSLTLAGFGWCAYNQAVTGSAWRMPYMHYWQVRSAGVPSTDMFIGAIHHQHQAEVVPTWSERIFSSQYSKSVVSKLLRQWRFWGTPALVPPLLVVAWTWRSWWTRLAGGTVLLVLLAVVSEGTWCHAHYLAPVGGLYIGLVVQGLRWLRQWHFQGLPSGRWFAPALPLLLAAATLQGLFTDWSERPHPIGHAWSLRRAAIQAQLDRLAGPHLVLIRYSPKHIVHYEWVYNRADRDQAHVVWAKWAPPNQLEPLLNYFSNRQVWVLNVDDDSPQLGEFRAPHSRSYLAEHAKPANPSL